MKQLAWSPRIQLSLVALVVLGAVCFIVGLNTTPERAWSAYLVGYFYWLCISLSGVFFVALQHISGSTWCIPLRRISEIFIAYLPVAILLFIILLFGVHTLYEWNHHEVVAADHLLSQKTGYLNVPFFVVRGLILFALCIGLGGWMVKNSLKQDETGEARLTLLNMKIAAPFLIIFGWSFTFVAIDLMMSLMPHWFSTIFGVYCWSGLFYSGLAMTLLWAIVLKRRGYLTNYVTPEHYHGMGKYMFAFVVFWTYIAFSQFMLIWYANLPEETIYYLPRLEGGWDCVTKLLVLVKFVIPFFLVISQAAKRNEKFMIFVCLWFLVAQWVDIYWMVYPNFFENPVFGFMDIGIFAGFAGLFFLSVGHFAKRVNLVPVQDPQLEEGVKHHQ
jgi:hypothetical protein